MSHLQKRSKNRRKPASGGGTSNHVNIQLKESTKDTRNLDSTRPTVAGKSDNAGEFSNNQFGTNVVNAISGHGEFCRAKRSNDCGETVNSSGEICDLCDFDEALADQLSSSGVRQSDYDSNIVTGSISTSLVDCKSNAVVSDAVSRTYSSASNEVGEHAFRADAKQADAQTADAEHFAVASTDVSIELFSQMLLDFYVSIRSGGIAVRVDDSVCMKPVPPDVRDVISRMLTDCDLVDLLPLLELVITEHVHKVRDSLISIIRNVLCWSKVTEVSQAHAYCFVKLYLDEYRALVAGARSVARILSDDDAQLEKALYGNWESVNKHVFYSLIHNDDLIRDCITVCLRKLQSARPRRLFSANRALLAAIAKCEPQPVSLSDDSHQQSSDNNNREMVIKCTASELLDRHERVQKELEAACIKRLLLDAVHQTHLASNSEKKRQSNLENQAHLLAEASLSDSTCCKCGEPHRISADAARIARLFADHEQLFADFATSTRQDESSSAFTAAAMQNVAERLANQSQLAQLIERLQTGAEVACECDANTSSMRSSKRERDAASLAAARKLLNIPMPTGVASSLLEIGRLPDFDAESSEDSKTRYNSASDETDSDDDAHNPPVLAANAFSHSPDLPDEPNFFAANSTAAVADWLSLTGLKTQSSPAGNPHYLLDMGSILPTRPTSEQVDDFCKAVFDTAALVDNDTCISGYPVVINGRLWMLVNGAECATAPPPVCSHHSVNFLPVSESDDLVRELCASLTTLDHCSSETALSASVHVEQGVMFIDKPGLELPTTEQSMDFHTKTSRITVPIEDCVYDDVSGQESRVEDAASAGSDVEGEAGEDEYDDGDDDDPLAGSGSGALRATPCSCQHCAFFGRPGVAAAARNQRMLESQERLRKKLAQKKGVTRLRASKSQHTHSLDATFPELQAHHHLHRDAELHEQNGAHEIVKPSSLPDSEKGVEECCASTTGQAHKERRNELTCIAGDGDTNGRLQCQRDSSVSQDKTEPSLDELVRFIEGPSKSQVSGPSIATSSKSEKRKRKKEKEKSKLEAVKITGGIGGEVPDSRETSQDKKTGTSKRSTDGAITTTTITTVNKDANTSADDADRGAKKTNTRQSLPQGMSVDVNAATTSSSPSPQLDDKSKLGNGSSKQKGDGKRRQHANPEQNAKSMSLSTAKTVANAASIRNESRSRNVQTRFRDRSNSNSISEDPVSNVKHDELVIPDFGEVLISLDSSKAKNQHKAKVKEVKPKSKEKAVSVQHNSKRNDAEKAQSNFSTKSVTSASHPQVAPKSTLSPNVPESTGRVNSRHRMTDGPTKQQFEAKTSKIVPDESDTVRFKSQTTGESQFTTRLAPVGPLKDANHHGFPDVASQHVPNGSGEQRDRQMNPRYRNGIKLEAFVRSSLRTTANGNEKPSQFVDSSGLNGDHSPRNSKSTANTGLRHVSASVVSSSASSSNGTTAFPQSGSEAQRYIRRTERAKTYQSVNQNVSQSPSQSHSQRGSLRNATQNANRRRARNFYGPQYANSNTQVSQPIHMFGGAASYYGDVPLGHDADGGDLNTNLWQNTDLQGGYAVYNAGPDGIDVDGTGTAAWQAAWSTSGAAQAGMTWSADDGRNGDPTLLTGAFDADGSSSAYHQLEQYASQQSELASFPYDLQVNDSLPDGADRHCNVPAFDSYDLNASCPTYLPSMMADGEVPKDDQYDIMQPNEANQWSSLTDNYAPFNAGSFTFAYQNGNGNGSGSGEQMLTSVASVWNLPSPRGDTVQNVPVTSSDSSFLNLKGSLFDSYSNRNNAAFGVFNDQRDPLACEQTLDADDDFDPEIEQFKQICMSEAAGETRERMRVQVNLSEIFKKKT